MATLWIVLATLVLNVTVSLTPLAAVLHRKYFASSKDTPLVVPLPQTRVVFRVSHLASTFSRSSESESSHQWVLRSL